MARELYVIEDEPAGWLIVNLTRGLFDGYYAEHAMAVDVALYWRDEVYPEDAIVVVPVGDVENRKVGRDRWMKRGDAGLDK